MAMNGQLRRVTKRVQRLVDYSDNLHSGFRSSAHREDAESGEVLEEVDVLHSAETAAENELKDYLRQGYDPAVVIAQLDVLRRAQQLRRPMRRVK